MIIVLRQVSVYHSSMHAYSVNGNYVLNLKDRFAELQFAKFNSGKFMYARKIGPAAFLKKIANYGIINNSINMYSINTAVPVINYFSLSALSILC